MKIGLIGAAGQLAADLLIKLDGHDVHSMTRSEIDICRPESIEAALHPHEFDVIINTAAYNLVDKAESEPLAAFEVNGAGVANLARYVGTRGWRLIHFSTDYVFGQDESRSIPWSESDLPGPSCIYGISKLAGEHAVLAYAQNSLVLRTCGLYGHKGSRGKGGNFVETMLKLADSGKPLRIVGNQFCTPSFTNDIADATRLLLHTNAQGILNLTNDGSCSWCEFARAIFELAGKKVDLTAITSEEFGAPARRPAYSVLSLNQLERLGLPKMPHWRDAVERYLKNRPGSV
jgi:dTDP-4-dehydrorhamnose reductase